MNRLDELKNEFKTARTFFYIMLMFFVILLFGAVLFTFQGAPKMLFNLKYQQPFVVSGGLLFAFDIIIGLIAYYTHRDIKKLKHDYEDLKKRREERQKIKDELKGNNKKEIINSLPLPLPSTKPLSDYPPHKKGPF